jgi:enoyl-CoA hydratase/carnithine racemase
MPQGFEFKTRMAGAAAWIDINRPDEGNSFTRDMMRTFADTVRSLSASPDVRVIAVESRGDQFCKGRDGRGEQRSGVSAYDMRKQMMGPVLDTYAALAKARVPTVACVHGPAIGFGAALAAACDVTLASAAATFSFPEIDHDIPPTLAMSALLSKVPSKILSYLIYSGETIDAAAAQQAGLVSKIWPGDKFVEDAQAFVAKLAERPGVNLETIKLYQRNATTLSPEMASEYAGTLLALVRSR